MKKQILFGLLLVIGLSFAAGETYAQKNRKSVSGAEVTGTFRMNFSGKFKGSYNEIKIQALGRGRLKVSFELIYPYIDGYGEMTANMGEASGFAEIKGDVAEYNSSEFGDCRIKIKFVRPGVIDVEHETAAGGCGFGMNVSAGGRYRKTSSAKPKFEF